MKAGELGNRGRYHMNHEIGRREAAVASMYKSNLEDFGVVGVEVSSKMLEGAETRVGVSMTITFKDGEKRSAILERYVDTSSFDVSETFLKAFCGASDEEVQAFMDKLDSGANLQELDDAIFEHYCLDYALASTAHDDGGEWTDQDYSEARAVFQLV